MINIKLIIDNTVIDNYNKYYFTSESVTEGPERNK